MDKKAILRDHLFMIVSESGPGLIRAKLDQSPEMVDAEAPSTRTSEGPSGARALPSEVLKIASGYAFQGPRRREGRRRHRAGARRGGDGFDPRLRLPASASESAAFVVPGRGLPFREPFRESFRRALTSVGMPDVGTTGVGVTRVGRRLPGVAEGFGAYQGAQDRVRVRRHVGSPLVRLGGWSGGSRTPQQRRTMQRRARGKGM